MAKDTGETPSAALTRPGDTAQEAYVRLRDLIVEGVYQPGQRLAHGRLMETLGVGRTPLRTALSRLEGDGLVIATPNQGVQVAPTPLSSGEEIYALRFLVEPPLLEAQAPSIGASELARLRELLEAMQDCLDDPAAFAVVHRDFHTVSRQSFTNPFIDELVAAMYRHLHRFHNIHAVRQRYPQDFLTLDRATVDALEAGDGLCARRVLELHLIDAGIAFLHDVDPDYAPTLLLDVARANGVEIDTAADGTIPPGARIAWRTPCVTLPALRTAHLVYEPPA